MKRLGGILAAISLLLVIGPADTARAAACANVSSFGAVSLSIPELKEPTSQVLWVRMQAPTTDSKILADIDNANCVEVGGYQQPADAWTWQTYREHGVVTPVKLAPNSTIKLIGVDSGVKIDRILLTEPECVPQDFGNNCRQGIELKTSDEQPEILPPPSSESVSGTVMLSQTPRQHETDLQELRYSTDGKVLQSTSTAEPLDTTLLPNGKHAVTIETILKDGSIITEKTVLEVKNSENFLTPVVRWFKMNKEVITKLALYLGAFIGVIIVFGAAHTWRKARRERSFHGF